MPPQPPPIRYQSVNALPPNEGIPLGRIVMVPAPAATPQQSAAGPETPADQDTEQALSDLRMEVNLLSRQLQAQGMARNRAQTPPAADPLAVTHDGVTYLFSKMATIRFVKNGLRPCDYPGLWTSRFDVHTYKVPVSLTGGELVERIGEPYRGLQEMVELGEPTAAGTRWGQGQILSRNGSLAALTLVQVGWDEMRDEDDPVWVVLGPWGA